MVMRFDPFREMDRVSQMLNQQVGGRRAFSIPMDVYRTDDRFVVLMDLPGVDPQSVDLTVERNVLTVRAERTWEPGPNEEVIVQERPQGVFTRQIFLGEALDIDHIEARYENGVLNLTIPVSERAKPRKVPIAATSTSGEAIEARTTG